jgi:hypothetical protein
MLLICINWNTLRRKMLAGRLAVGVLVLTSMVVSPAPGAILWDAEAGTHWWFDPFNWNAAGNANTVLPPSNNATGTSATDTIINLGTGVWNQGQGVVFDPTDNDPNFAAAAAIPFPTNFNRQKISNLFLSRGTTESTKLTIKGNLTAGTVHVGSASGMRGTATNATIVQESGTVTLPIGNLILAEAHTSSVGYGNGTYEYRGGTLEVAQQGGDGMSLSVGTNSPAFDNQKAGPGGVGKFIVHNPDTPGHVRVYNLTTATFAGFDENILNNPNDSEFNAEFDSNGETTGVGIFEFHYANGGTRPIQVNNNMILNNGLDNNTKGTRSSRLDLVLDEAPCDGTGCMPSSIGLFDIGFDGSGSLQGSGDLDGDNMFNDDKVFSSIDNATDFREGDIVSALFGSTRYDWMISYSGDINWSNASDSVISSITGMGTGNDIVLIGVGSSSGMPGDFDDDGDVDGRDFLAWQRGSSPTPFSAEDLADWQANYGVGPMPLVSAVPEPTTVALICAAVLPLLGRRRS